jgi:hypothetical protein
MHCLALHSLFACAFQLWIMCDTVRYAYRMRREKCLTWSWFRALTALRLLTEVRGRDNLVPACRETHDRSSPCKQHEVLSTSHRKCSEYEYAMFMVSRLEVPPHNGEMAAHMAAITCSGIHI